MPVIAEILPDPKRLVHGTYSIGAVLGSGRREYRVALTELGEQRPRRNKPGHVIHLAPVENAGNVIVDAVRKAGNAGAECVEISAHKCHGDTWLQRRAE